MLCYTRNTPPGLSLSLTTLSALTRFTCLSLYQPSVCMCTRGGVCVRNFWEALLRLFVLHQPLIHVPLSTMSSFLSMQHSLVTDMALSPSPCISLSHTHCMGVLYMGVYECSMGITDGSLSFSAAHTHPSLKAPISAMVFG